LLTDCGAGVTRRVAAPISAVAYHLFFAGDQLGMALAQ
jgi:hypothetical protein